MSLPRRLVAFLSGGYHADRFQADRDLISNVALATDMELVREAVADFFIHPANRGWLRNVAGIRISTTRLKSIAREFFRDDESVLPRTNRIER